MGALIDTERKGSELIIHDHDCDLWVTMVGWVDVPHSDWGDFRRRRVVDISSFLIKFSLVSHQYCFTCSLQLLLDVGRVWA